MTLGSPLQRIAMGMVIVIGTAMFPAHPSPSWAQYDALPDPVGWLLVLTGAVALARLDDDFVSVRWLAVVAGVVSVPMWVPQVHHVLNASGQWAASLPQIAFCLWLSRQIGVLATLQEPRDAYAAKRFGLLVWGFGAVAVLPVLAIGGGIDALVSTTLLVSTAVSVAFVYFLFRVHRRTWLGGPGPLLVQPSRRTDPAVESPADEPGTHEGRPPSS
jgi:hypothetical protein